MRLINADALLADLGINDLDCTKCDWYGGSVCVKDPDFRDACVAIENAPTVDAVKVVRCKDCALHNPKDHNLDCVGLMRSACIFMVANGDAFHIYGCSYGKRRNDEGNVSEV